MPSYEHASVFGRLRRELPEIPAEIVAEVCARLAREALTLEDVATRAIEALREPTTD